MREAEREPEHSEGDTRPEGARQAIAGMSRFLERRRELRSVSAEGAAEPAEGTTERALDREPRLPEGAPPYRDASDRPVFPDHLDIETVRQGRLGDCSLIASIDAVAHRDPERIAGLVQLQENGDVLVTAGRAEPIAQTLPHLGDPAEPRLNEAGDVYANSADGSTLGPYLEKAYARDLGGYDELDRGVWPKDALQYLSGRPAVQESTAMMSEARLAWVLGPECATVAHAPERGDEDPLAPLADDYDVVTEGSHAYAVRGTDENGEVLLHNPWGFRHPKPMPSAVFRRLFPVVSSCEMEKGGSGEG